jgi:tRNA (guanine9-N1)-methyltransferase
MNRRAQPPAKLIFSSFTNQIEQITNEKYHGQHLNWQVTRESNAFHQVFPTDKMVYLTADSPNRIGTLEEGHYYIIGGIVDHNRYKGLCLDKAEALGIQHGHLPISEYIQLASRRILTVNQVVEIMLKYVEHQDWKKAFLECIPPRKMVETPNDNN